MAIFSSILVNRQIKSFLACDDLSTSNGIDVTNKLIATGKEGVPKILEAMNNASEKQQKSLKKVCDEILKTSSLDVFLDEMENQQSEVRSNAKDFLSESQTINPVQLLNKLLDPDVQAEKILEIVEYQKQNLKPEQLISLALKLSGKTSNRLFKMANSVAKNLDIESFQLKPSKVDSPDKKLHILNFLALIKHPKASKIAVLFTSDQNNMVKLAALNSLKQINQSFDVLPLLQTIPTMKESERDLAIPLVRTLADERVIGRLSPMLTNSDEKIQHLVASVIVEKANADTFRQLLIGIEKREEWARNVSVNLLLDEAKGKLSGIAQPLTLNANEFIRNTAAEFVEDGLAFGNVDDIAQAALHKDWQIRDKAITALGQSKQKTALVVLFKVIRRRPESIINALKAIASLGFSKGLEIAVKGLDYREVAIQRESLVTIRTIVNEKHAQNIQNVIIKKIPSLNKVVSDTVEEVLVDINKKFKLKPLPKNLKFLLSFSQEPDEHIDPLAQGEVSQKIFDLNDLKPGVEWAGRYKVIKEIGRGAMGRALLATDNMVDERIVIKFMNPELTANKTARERFVRELKFARKISHNNVIRIHDFLHENNVSAIAMEYFESSGLDEALKKGTVYKEKEGLAVMSQITAGMQAAHNENVAHRDLKPSNILINAAGKVKVVDFGIASVAAEIDSSLTKTGTIVGTPSYISPERAKGKDSDHRADIYAVGIISYYMLTGALPYKGEAMSLLFQHIEGKAKAVRVKNKAISQTCSDIVAKMMAVDPEKRYQNMLDAKADIDQLLEQ